jgi:Spy/CpxP family protein refolding chaperone
MERGFENLRLLKLMEAVDLTEKQSEDFVPLFHAFRREMRQLKHQRREQVRELRDLVEADADDKKIGETIEKLQANQRAATTRQDEFLNRCAKILSPRQVARLVVFQEEFELRVLESLREFRQRAAPTADEQPKE